MSELNLDLIKKLRFDIDKALGEVGRMHEVTLKTAKCEYDLAFKNFTFQLEGVAKGGVDRDGARYLSLRLKRPTLPPLRSTFVNRGKTHEIVGASKTGSKILTKCDGQSYEVAVATVERLCSK